MKEVESWHKEGHKVSRLRARLRFLVILFVFFCSHTRRVHNRQTGIIIGLPEFVSGRRRVMRRAFGYLGVFLCLSSVCCLLRSAAGWVLRPAVKWLGVEFRRVPFVYVCVDSVEFPLPSSSCFCGGILLRANNLVLTLHSLSSRRVGLLLLTTPYCLAAIDFVFIYQPSSGLFAASSVVL